MILSVAGTSVPDFTRLGLGLVLASDALVGDDGSVIGDPTEAALVVLAAKLGIDADETRRTYPRLAEVPFDSDYKFMATFHRVQVDGTEHTIELVKGAPDVVIARCAFAGGPLSGSQVAMVETRDGIEVANQRMGQKGLRVLAFAARLITDAEHPTMTDRPDVADPRALVRRTGRDHRPAPGGGEERRADRPDGRHRRADDHRRPRRHRPRDRRGARTRAGCDQRDRAPSPGATPSSRSSCPACTCSAG